MIRAEPHYRRDAFMAGLRAAGFDARTGPPQGCQSGDVLVMWNRYAENHEIATRFEQQGGTVLVAENGYVRGRHDGGTYYALAIGGHNGSGQWHVGGPERWDSLGVELKAWRATGDHVLVCPNRSFGRPDTIMPYDWPRKVVERLKAVTKRPIRVRPHPGNDKPKVPLDDDLRGAHCVVIWSSSVGVRALIEGIPVVCEAPFWIAKGSTASSFRTDSCSPPKSERLKALQALAWAQFSISEIASGEPFRYLLGAGAGRENSETTRGVAATAAT